MDTQKIKPTDLTVRLATFKDVTKIESLIKEEAVSRGGTDSTPTVKQLLADGFEGPPWYYALLAERGGAALGVAVFHRGYWTWSGRTLRLRGLYVRPRARRAGVGRTLFLELCHLARVEGAQLDWEVPDDDPAAQAFFATFRGTPNGLSEGVYSMLMDEEVIAHVSKIGIQETEGDDVTVRRARRDDIPEAYKMIVELAEFEGDVSALQVTETELIRDAFCLSPWLFVLVAERQGRLVGLVVGSRMWRHRARGFFLQTLYVDPRARRCGVAQKLMGEFCRMAADQGVSVVEFHAFRENLPSLVLYRRLGAFDAPRCSAHALRLTRDQLQSLL